MQPGCDAFPVSPLPIVTEQPEVFGALSFAFPVADEGSFQLGIPDLLFFAVFLAAFQLFPTIPFHLLSLGAGRAGAGLFLTVYTWASALSAPFTGAIADRLGKRRAAVN